MSIAFNGTTGLTFPDNTTQATSPFTGGMGFRNRIINGAMMIDQRNAGTSVTNTGTGNFIYTVDRWAGFSNISSKFSTQQNAGSVTPPAGFKNYLGATSLSSYSVGAGEYFALCQVIEGFNTSDLSWGTSSASTVTLSFWVRSSLTGTFGGSLGNYSGNRSYPFVYTISAANTWEQKTVTIAGETTGTWQTNNTGGIYLYFGLGMGSTYSGTAGAWSSGNYFSATGATSVVGTSGATFYITGVQLEKGSTATSFDYRPYGTELALCQRYAWKLGYNSTNNAANQVGAGFIRLSTTAIFQVQFPVTMRTAASMTVPNSAGYFNVSWGSSDTNVATLTIGGGGTQISADSASVATTALSAATVGYGATVYVNNASSYILFSAEL